MPRAGCRSVSVLAAVLAAVPVICAQTPTTGPAETSDGIAGAKRELEAVKAAAIPGAAAAVRPLQGLDLPALHAPSAEVTSRSPVEAARRTEPQSRAGAWVLPEAQARSRPRGGGAAESEDARATGDRGIYGFEPTSPTSPRQLEAGLAAPPRDGAALKPVNPLAPFLSGWISAQDYPLLAKERETDPAAAPGTFNGGAGRSSTAAEAGTGGLSFESRRSSNAAVRPGYESAERGPNPYLENFVSAPAPARVGGMPSPAVTPAPVSAPLVSPPLTTSAFDSQPVAPSRIPDFVRSTADEKYFKPLKRF